MGFQIGGSSTDLIMLVMSERGADKLLESKFTLGAEGSVAAGPVGRTATAQTDAQMHADILSWSRSQGLFAGVALEGATLRQDLDDNADAVWQEAGESRHRDEGRARAQGRREAARAAEPVLGERTHGLVARPWQVRTPRAAPKRSPIVQTNEEHKRRLVDLAHIGAQGADSSDAH